MNLSEARDNSTWAVSWLAELTVTPLPSPSFPPLSPVCTGTTPACGNTCARGAGTHGDVLNLYTEVFLRAKLRHTPHHTHNTQHTTHNTQHNTTQHTHHTHHRTPQHTTPHGDRDRETQRQRQTETERDRERRQKQRETERDRERDRERETRQDKKREDETIKEKKLEDEKGETRR